MASAQLSISTLLTLCWLRRTQLRAHRSNPQARWTGVAATCVHGTLPCAIALDSEGLLGWCSLLGSVWCHVRLLLAGKGCRHALLAASDTQPRRKAKATVWPTGTKGTLVFSMSAAALFQAGTSPCLWESKRSTDYFLFIELVFTYKFTTYSLILHSCSQPGSQLGSQPRSQQRLGYCFLGSQNIRPHLRPPAGTF